MIWSYSNETVVSLFSSWKTKTKAEQYVLLPWLQEGDFGDLLQLSHTWNHDISPSNRSILCVYLFVFLAPPDQVSSEARKFEVHRGGWLSRFDSC